MQESCILDQDGQTWPDPLTIDYVNGSLSKLPTEYKITARDLQRKWTMMWEQYGMNEMDDIWLSINGINYIMELKPSDVIYKVVPEDLEGFITQKQVGTE
jgi:hypothetical protein